MSDVLKDFVKFTTDFDYLDREIETMLAHLECGELVDAANDFMYTGEDAKRRWSGKILHVILLREWCRRRVTCRKCSWVGPMQDGLCETCQGETSAGTFEA